MPLLTENVDLTRAQAVLAQIATTSERDFLASPDLDHVGQFTSEQISQAFLTVARAILASSHDLDLKYGALQTTQKILPQGQLSLHISHRPTPPHRQLTPATLSLDLRNRLGTPRMEFTLPLSQSPLDTQFTSFTDSRANPPRQVHLANADHGLRSPDIAHLFRGLRWTAASLLHWHGGHQAPEDLDTHPDHLQIAPPPRP